MRRSFSWAASLFLVLPFLVASPNTAAAQYVGVSKCRPCHLAQTKSWEETKMAKAFELLKPGVAADVKRSHKLDPDKDYTGDPNCLSCHVTGYKQPGGFVDVKTTPGLAGVGCEVCHGAGAGYLKPTLMSLQNKEYKRKDLVAAGMVIPSAQVCQTCHNPKSPFFKEFDYEARKQQGIHAHQPLKYPHE